MGGERVVTQADRRRALMAMPTAGGLPSAYRQVEYISNDWQDGADSTGGKCPVIYTGAPIQNIYPIVITTEFRMCDAGMYNGYVLTNLAGATGNPTLAMAFRKNLYMRVGSSTTDAEPNSGDKANTVIKATMTITEDGTECDFEENGTHYIAISPSVPESIPSIALFYNVANGVAHGRIYSAAVRQQGTTVLQLVPCYRIADGEIGVYDLVGKAFLTNGSNGAFAKGEDV